MSRKILKVFPLSLWNEGSIDTKEKPCGRNQICSGVITSWREKARTYSLLFGFSSPRATILHQKEYCRMDPEVNYVLPTCGGEGYFLRLLRKIFRFSSSVAQPQLLRIFSGRTNRSLHEGLEK